MIHTIILLHYHHFLSCCYFYNYEQFVSYSVSFNPITPGGGVFRTRSYFQLILTIFWTRGTIFKQLIVKGVRQWSCGEKNLRVPLNLPELSQFFSARKISQNFEQKFGTKIFELKMAIAQSIFKILRSSFLQTPPFL